MLNFTNANITENTPEDLQVADTNNSDIADVSNNTNIAEFTAKSIVANVDDPSLGNFEITLEKGNLEEEHLENKNPQENLKDISCEPTNINIEDANTTNCLALTIQKDHKIVAVKNVFIRSIRMSWKVIVSAITLGLIKLFS